jgi:hypothetical protein
MQTIVVGDVHGCLNELRALVQRCSGGRDARVVLVGDLVAKGPDSAGVVQWARESGALAVLGNHDAHVLRMRPGPPGADEARRQAKAHHTAVADSLSTDDWAWMEELPTWLALDAEARPLPAERGAHWLVVHAGLVPGVALRDQKREHLLNLRSVAADGSPSKRIEGAPWASRWVGPPHVVFGHDAVRGLQRHAWATGLDTGCVYGHELTALVLPKGELVSVPARRTYAEL